jgi:hypothetical protein
MAQSKCWMTDEQLHSSYDVLTPDNPIEINFNPNTVVSISGNGATDKITIDEKDVTGYTIIGRDNSAISNSSNVYIIKNPDGYYASVTLDTNYAQLDENGKPYNDSADCVTRHQFNGNLMFTDNNEFNKFVGDSQAVIDTIKQERLEYGKRTVDVSFDNVITSYGEKLVVPSNTNINVSAIQNRMEPTIWAYGLPPQWTKYVDPRTMGFTTCEGSGASGPRINVGLGRRYTEVIVSNPTVLEIAPGYIRYSKWMNDFNIEENINKFNSGTQTETSVQGLLAAFNNHSHGRFYRIEPCFSDRAYYLNQSHNDDFKFGGYISYVTYLMIIVSVFLSREEVQRTSGSTGAGNVNGTTFKKFYSNGTSEDVKILSDRLSPLNGKKYKEIDWEEYNKHSGKLTIGGVLGISAGGSGILGALGNALNNIGGYVGGASNEDGSSNAHETSFDYMKFYLSGSTNATDSFSTSVEDSMLGQLANTLNMAMKETAYWLDSVGGDVVSKISSAAEGIINAVDIGGVNPLSGIFNISEMLGGGKIVFPQIITDSKYGKSIECECTFASIYGDEEAMFINTLMPYMHLLAFVLPHQVRTSLEMYTFPFIVKAFCRGLFNVEMGAITSFSVQRGGNDNALWSFNGAAEIVTVNFEITPLINTLVMTSTQDGPGWLLKNTGLHEYMSAITAFDARNDKFDLAYDIFMGAFGQTQIAKASNILTSALQSNLVSSVINAGRMIENADRDLFDWASEYWTQMWAPVNRVNDNSGNAQVPPNTNINDYDTTGQAQGLIGGNNTIVGG